MNWRDPEFRRNLLVLGSWKSEGNRRRLVTVAFLMLVLVAVSMWWTGYPFTTNPSLCGQLCHVTYAEYESWSQSTHGDVPCHRCHQDSPSQKVLNPIARTIMTRLNNFSKPVNADSSFSQKHVSKARCLYCHAQDAPNRSNRLVPRPQGAIHRRHTRAGLQCTTCHNRIAHLGAERFQPIATWQPNFVYLDFMNMREGCWRCHSADGRWLDQETLDMVQGPAPSTECKLCHKAVWTQKPREGKINHNDLKGVPWALGDRHGQVATEDFFVCLGCHDRKPRPKESENPPDCSYACHDGIVMPHNSPTFAKYYKNLKLEPEWMSTHSDVAAKAGVVKSLSGIVKDPRGICSKCHNKSASSDNFCDECHHRDLVAKMSAGGESTVNAGRSWRVGHKQAVVSRGAATCHKCHVFEFCTNCHTRVEVAS